MLRAKPPLRPAARAAVQITALAGLAALSAGCWTTNESEVDPLEAQPREVDVRTEAEEARDARFSDRRKRRVHLDQPTAGQANDAK